MFSLLKRRFKSFLARLFFDTIHIKHEAQTWTRTMFCPTCKKLVAIDARFCAQCGKCILEAHTQPNLQSIQIDHNGAIIMEPVNIIMPNNDTKRRFLNYVRRKKDNAGPATKAHRYRQDLENVC